MLSLGKGPGNPTRHTKLTGTWTGLCRLRTPGSGIKLITISMESSQNVNSALGHLVSKQLTDRHLNESQFIE